jgi:hypothetical protein
MSSAADAERRSTSSVVCVGRVPSPHVGRDLPGVIRPGVVLFDDSGDALYGERAVRSIEYGALTSRLLG